MLVTPDGPVLGILQGHKAEDSEFLWKECVGLKNHKVTCTKEAE